MTVPQSPDHTPASATTADTTPASTPHPPSPPGSFAWVVILSPPRRGRLYRVKASGLMLGRNPDNDIVFHDEAISRHHARIYAEARAEGLSPQFFIQDLATVNGVFVNSRRVVKQALRDNDRIRLGATQLVFKQL